jgi:predicted SAM-dependent methyltransferase
LVGNDGFAATSFPFQEGDLRDVPVTRSLGELDEMIQKIKNLIRRRIPITVSFATALRHLSSRRKIRGLLKVRREICIEVGAGARRGTREWVTLDLNRTCDIYWDLRRGIPFPDDSIKKIYSSHFFEHLSFGEIQRFLDECRRVLAPNGKFLICVPNARIYIEAYARGSALDTDTYFVFKPAYNHTTRIDYVNYAAYMDGQHKYMFDEENLIFILKSKGFRNVRLRQFDSSLDLQERDFESIYAEAEK